MGGCLRCGIGGISSLFIALGAIWHCLRAPHLDDGEADIASMWAQEARLVPNGTSLLALGGRDKAVFSKCVSKSEFLVL